MSDSVVYIISITLLIALAGLAFWITRQSFGGPGAMFFQNKQKRLSLVESTSVDSKHRLLLVRRDDVEHLILTGGPIDLVVETGIPARANTLNGLGQVLARADNDLDGGQSFTSEEDSLVLQREQTN
jgi:flagellar protein FliO/FliZ